MKNQVNVIPPKGTNKASITDPKEIDIYELSEKNFKITHLNKFSEIRNIQRSN